MTLNPNQLRAHLQPILELSEVARITLLADTPGPPMLKLRSVVPPPWLIKAVGRAAAKLVTGIRLSLQERPSWVIGYNIVPHGLNALIIGRLSRARVLVHLIGGPVEWEGGGYQSDNAVLSRLRSPAPRLERFLMWIVSRADAVAVMGSGARDRLIEYGLDPERVVVLPAAVDTRRFRRGRENPQYHLITASQLIERKRVEDLLEAVAVLRRNRPDLRVAIAGQGPLASELQQRARELDVADTVTFLGFVADLAPLFAASCVFVLTSRAEGLSIALTEAMAAELPVIATDVGEVREIVTPGRTGFLYHVGDVKALVEYTDRLLGDVELQRMMGREGRRSVEEHASYDRVAELSRDVLTRSATTAIG